MKQFKFVLIFVLLLSLTVFSANTFAQEECDLSSDRAPLPAPIDGMSGTISSPEDCSEVAHSPTPVSVSGTADVSDGYTPWVLVYVDGLYYPQPAATENGDGTCTVTDMNNGDGTWDTTAYFGDPDNPQPLTFDVVLIAADADLHALLVAYYEPDCGNGTGIAPDDLAGGSYELAAILVQTINLPPVAEDFTIELNEDEVEDFNFLDYASDPDGDELTVIVDSDPAVGTLTVNEDGTANFAPDAEWSGTTSFTYHVNDGELDSNVATVWIIVLPVNDPPNCEALAANISTIWSPNHEMVSVSIDESSISDIDSTIFEITLTDITHDEAINGLGDGNTDPDWDLEAGTIRAERSGTGNGRTYTISANVNDMDWIDTFEDLEGLFESTPEPIDGGDCNGAVEVFVPHDMSDKKDNAVVVEENLAVCHMPPGNTEQAKTLYVGSQSSIDAHLAHGDILGVCPEPSSNENAHGNNPNANPNAAQASNNGKGSENSNNGNNNSNAAAANNKGNGNGKGNGKGNN